jgi:hypothetical protein
MDLEVNVQNCVISTGADGMWPKGSLRRGSQLLIKNISGFELKSVAAKCVKLSD